MDQSSSLTSLDGLSTPESYYTAKGSRSPVNSADTTAISTPVKDEENPPYRDAQLIPHELRQNCQIHLEEQLYLQTIHLFQGFLSDGNKLSTTRPPPPAIIPTPSQLALLNTLTIHPLYTNRAPERSYQHISTHAFAYLRGLVYTVGPVNANLRQAFSFSGSDRGTGRGRGLNSSSDDDSDSDWTGNKLATVQSIWRRAPDFWSALGWAFQCASAHPHRWRTWKHWVHFMIEVLEKDWDELKLQEDQEYPRREQLAGSPPQKTKKKYKDHPHHKLRQSLIVSYIDDLHKQRKQPLREVMRALMAFLDVDSAADAVFYKEIFHGETEIGPRKNKRKRAQMVDLENDQFGDYLDGMDDFESEEEERDDSAGLPTTTKAPRRGRRAAGVGGGASKRQPKKETTAFQLSDSVAETITLRHRIFRLLSNVAAFLPDKLGDVSELYQMFSDRIRGLPLPTFKLFVGYHTAKLPEDQHVSLLSIMIDDLLPGVGSGSEKRPDPEKVDPRTAKANGISGQMLEKCYLPFASNRVAAEDNAQLSIVLESMLWYIYAEAGYEYTDDLRKAVEKGIKAREDKIRRKAATSDGSGGDKLAREALDRSARSLRALVDVWSLT
ncbi:hypothetical protein V8F20_008482 [Naviculisporaceae sp. PSN 640]